LFIILKNRRYICPSPLAWIGSALDSGKEVRVVFCDISKAFDRVWHKGLIHKLKQSGISGNLLKWFQNYLVNMFIYTTLHTF
jgi:hypothetical protein